MTGGAGFIGSHIVEKCVRDEHFTKIYVIDDLTNGSLINLSSVLDNPRVEFVQASVGNNTVIDKLTKECRFISHQAALGSVPKSVANPEAFFDVNVVQTFSLFNTARKNNVRKIVYLGSSVYGDLDSTIKTESTDSL